MTAIIGKNKPNNLKGIKDISWNTLGYYQILTYSKIGKGKYIKIIKKF